MMALRCKSNGEPPLDLVMAGGGRDRCLLLVVVLLLPESSLFTANSQGLVRDRNHGEQLEERGCKGDTFEGAEQTARLAGVGVQLEGRVQCTCSYKSQELVQTRSASE